MKKRQTPFILPFGDRMLANRAGRRYLRATGYQGVINTADPIRNEGGMLLRNGEWYVPEYRPAKIRNRYNPTGQ